MTTWTAFVLTAAADSGLFVKEKKKTRNQIRHFGKRKKERKRKKLVSFFLRSHLSYVKGLTAG